MFVKFRGVDLFLLSDDPGHKGTFYLFFHADILDKFSSQMLGASDIVIFNIYDGYPQFVL